MGHSIGLGYLVLTLRELSGLSQARLAARSRTSQPAIARLESGRQVPSVNTLSSRLGVRCISVVGLADPKLDVADLCHARPHAPRDLAASSGPPPDLFVIGASAVDWPSDESSDRGTLRRGESDLPGIAAP